MPNGPDGEKTPARRLKEDSSTGLHGITNGGTVPIAAEVGQVFTASIHVKAEALGRTHAYVGIGQDANGTELGAIYKVFDLSNGTVLSGTKTSGSSQPTAGAATITAVDQTVGIGFPLPQPLPPVTAFVFMPVRHRVAT